MNQPHLPATAADLTTAAQAHHASALTPRKPSGLLALTLTLGFALLSGSVPSSQAQQPSPVAPAAPGPTSSAASATGSLTVRAGAPDLNVMDAYRLARTPLTATVSVPAAAVATLTPTDPGATPPTNPPSTAPTVAPGLVYQLSPDPLTDVFAPVGVPLSAGAEAASTVSASVDFGFPSAGQRVFVQPFAGGAVDGDGRGHFVTLDAAGVLTFRFQPPARPGRYYVSLRRDNVESALRFLVYDPAAAGSDRKPARPTAGH